MKKSNIFVVLALSTILLIPFANIAKAQTPSYVGVNEGEVYTWKVDLEVDGIDEVMDNIGTLLDDIQDLIATLDLHGYENLTIPETMENISSTILNSILPSGWEGLNITDLLEAFISDFISDANSTMFSSNIPGKWGSLNLTTFADYIVNGLNDTLPASWEVEPIPNLIKIALNHFNSSLLFGIVPDGWEGFTIGELINQIILDQVPEAYESFMLHTLLNEILKENIPNELQLLSIEDILSSVIPASISSINVSSVLAMLEYIIPPGMASVNMSVLFHEVLLNVSSSLPPQFIGVNMSTILSGLIDQLITNYSTMLVGFLPTNFDTLTIKELADFLITQAISGWDTNVIPGWESSKAALALIPFLGFRVEITDIGTEVEAYPGGPSGVPINMTFFGSLDTNNWTDLADLTDLFGEDAGGLMTSQEDTSIDVTSIISMLLFNFTAYHSSYIVDPTSYSDPVRAFGEQGLLTGGLIVANNYDWLTVDTSFTIPVGINPNGFEGSAEWNSDGVLSLFSLDANGVNVITLSFLGSSDEIPGFEVGIILVLAPITILGLIYYMKKKDRI